MNAMEHRWTARKQTAFEAVIRYPGLGLVCGKVKNIGSGGMYLETGVIALSPNMPVDVTVRVRKGGTDDVCRLPAWVVWTGPSGAGLMFRTFDEATQAGLQENAFEHQGLVKQIGAGEGRGIWKHA